MSTLRQELAAFGLVALAFVLFSLLVASGGMSQADHALARTLAGAWHQALAPVFIGLALLGGVEATVLLGLGLFAFLWRHGFRSEALATLALPAVVLLEEIYKRVITHPAPTAFSHGDAPSVSSFFGLETSSFPSGHVSRALVAYGLLAFVTWRLAHPGWVRRLAIPAAGVVVLAEAFDRLYLGVHWESDVVGGLLLGGTCLLGGILWLDRPRRLAS